MLDKSWCIEIVKSLVYVHISHWQWDKISNVFIIINVINIAVSIFNKPMEINGAIMCDIISNKACEQMK